jgi:hypothetical protein
MVASDLATFGAHKAVLLAALLKVRKRGRGPIDFDAEQVWRDLARLADLYFWRERAQQQTIPNAALARRAGQLAKALDRARVLAKKDHIINDLFSALYVETNGPYSSAANQDFENSAVSRALDELEKAMDGLLVLTTAARRVANTRRPGGRPKGTSVLPPEYIVRLAILFRSSTGTRPGAGEGPFARFASAFLDAVGRKIADSAVIDAIKNARAQSLQQPSDWPASPFGPPED